MRTPHGSRLAANRGRKEVQSPLTDRMCLPRVPGLPQYGDSYLKVVAEPVPSPSLDPCAELLFSAYAP